MIPMQLYMQHNAKIVQYQFMIQANMASKKLSNWSSHLVFHKMFMDTLICFWSMATQAGAFTVVSVTKTIWLQTVLVMNVSKLMHLSTV